MVEKNSRRLVSLKPDIKEAPENMVIPEGIEIIGPAIFVSKNKFQCSNIKSVKFPDSLKKIETMHFSGVLTLLIFSSETGWNTLGKSRLLRAEGLKKSFFLTACGLLKARLLWIVLS